MKAFFKKRKIHSPKAPKPPTINRKALLQEALDGVGSKTSRLLITLIGTVLGISSLVATIGFAQTAGGQIAQQFDKLAATRVTVEPGTQKTQNNKERATAVIPWDAESRVKDLVGVTQASLYSQLPLDTKVTAVQVVDPAASSQVPPQVVAASAELLETVEGKLATGRFFDSGHDNRGDYVAVLGKDAAAKLGINRVSGQPAVFISDRAYTIIGILETVNARSSLLDSVIIPTQTARNDLGLPAPQAIDIRIEIGAGDLVARQAPIALNPNNPEGFKVLSPANTSALQENITADINLLFVAIGVVALLGGGIGISNVMLLSVAERRGEIGLRRALGARSRDIAGQFIMESLTTGLLGGLIGVSLGLFAILGLCLLQQWTPIFAPWIFPAGTLLGAFVGIASGTYPALKAARLEPVDALRDN